MTTTRRTFLRAATGTGAVVMTGGWPAFAQPRKPLRDVVILLPGIMGSVLQKNGRDVWAINGGSIVNALATLGGSIAGLTLTGDSPTPDDLGDGVRATKLIPDTHLIPGFWKIDGYSKISQYITTQFEATPGQNYFEFPYDWRRDNRAAARRLSRSATEWLQAWRKTSGNSDAKLVLVAHSMGGLICRYFLEVLEGWKDTRMLVTFGTPYRGSPNALNFLANGLKKTVGPLTLVDVTRLLRSFTSVYQLLPIYACVNPGTGSLVRVSEVADIPGLDRARAVAALAFHNEIRTAVERNVMSAEYRQNRYTIHPIIGTYQPTLQSARVTNGAVTMSDAFANDTTIKGDGTVPVPSARPIETPELEKQHRVVYVSEVHGSLQNSPAMLDHLGALLQEGAVAWDRFRAATVPNVAVIVDDVYSTTETVVVRAQCEDSMRALEATVVSAASGAVIARAPLKRTDAGSEAPLGPFPEGTYRVTVAGGPEVGSANDVFIVVKG